MTRSVLLPWLMVLLAGPLLQAATPPKVLVIFDGEGISGTLNPSYAMYGKAEYEQFRESLTADVNAAIRGLKSGGAGAIVVEDGHGSGNDQEPDILLSKMDKQGTLEFRDRPFDSYSTGIDGSFAAIVLVGQHARARTNGFMAHTYTFDVAWKVNGVDFTETHIAAMFGAGWGIPVIMVSGDNVLKEQLAPEFPELEYAVVKTVKSIREAEAVPRAEADQRIERAAREAMKKLQAGRFGPYYLPAPYDFKLSFRTAEEGQLAARTRGVAPDGDLGVRFGSTTFGEGYSVSLDAINRALNPLPLLVRILQREPGGKRILEQWHDLQFQRIDPEKLPAWADAPPQGLEKKRYWGGR